MYWHTRRKQIWSSSETNEPIYVVGSNTGWTVIRVKHEDYQQHKWARSFRWKTKSAFCACAITFRFYFFLRTYTHTSSGVPRNIFRGGGSTNSVEDRGQREQRPGGG